jgi:anti-sigma-K factor RskA
VISVAVPHDHDRFADLTGAYALGALTGPEREAFEAHLATCAVCAADVRSLTPVAAALAAAAPEADPSPAVRARLMARIETPKPRVQSSWLAAAAAVLIAVALGGYASQLRGRVVSLEGALRDAVQRADASERLISAARRDAGELRRTVAVLVAPDLARIDLAGQPAAPSASARAFWSRSRGLVFTASNLPSLPAGRVYQLWVLTAQPAPISAGLFTPDAGGGVTTTFDTPPDLPAPAAMAVTLEPEGGVPAPTGDKYLVGLAH